MMKILLKELIRWLITTLIIGLTVWIISNLYKNIKNRFGGR